VESQSGDSVSIEVKTPHSHNWWGFHGRTSIHVELRVPREIDTDISTGDGNVTAQNLAGNLRFRTGDGNIDASGLHGSITVKTGDGNVTSQGLDGTLDAETGDGNLNIRGRFDSLRLRTGDGNVNTEAGHGSKLGNGWTISSGDGSIVLRVPGDLAADLDVRTGDGSITLDLPVQVSGSLSRSSIRGKMNGGGGELRVQSGDGSIHIEKI
jgi:DUF4097 and DUF4098 domain-containing protein YvlB